MTPDDYGSLSLLQPEVTKTTLETGWLSVPANNRGNSLSVLSSIGFITMKMHKAFVMTPAVAGTEA